MTKLPVQSKLGWHLLIREESRTQTVPPLDSIRGQIINAIKEKKFGEHLTELRQKADIQYKANLEEQKPK
jgi:peptidyl-prolyl cis-trans isomerase C